jgi:hypothetical protein
MADINLAIRQKFGVHRGDNAPYVGRIGSRSLLAVLLGELGFNRGAEIGVHQGGYSDELLAGNPNLTLFSIDPWSLYREQRNQDRQDKYYQQTIARLAKYEGRAIIMREFSVEASKRFDDGELDFVYIDAAHDFDNVMLDLIHWYPKVKTGGIFAGHDYWHQHCFGIIQAVDAFIKGHGINDWYVTNNEPVPSWLWVKP